MGKFVQKDVYIALTVGTALVTPAAGTYVFSDHANNCEITDEADEVDFTCFSSNAYKEYGQGLKDATVAVTFLSDFGTNSIHSILQPLYSGAGTFGVEIRPTSGSVSATNPKATMTGRLFAYSGIAGGIGDAASFDCTIRNASSTGLVWATA